MSLDSQIDEVPRSPLNIVVPPTQMPIGRRLLLRLLRALPVGRTLGFSIFRRLVLLAKRHRRATTYFGATIDCDLSDLIPMCIFYFGVWEPHISGLIERRLRPGDVFCDVGANIGYDSLLAAKLVGSSGRVVALEPSPTIYRELIRNLELNDAGNVRPVQVAVAAEPGTISLYSGGDPHNAGKTTTIEGQGLHKLCDVAALPLEDVLSREECARLRLIKIDVEGAERPILTHLADTIDRYPADIEILVEISAPRTTQEAVAVDDIFSRFARLGFRAYSVFNSYDVDKGYINFRGVKPPTPTKLPIIEQQDILFCRSNLDTAMANGLYSSLDEKKGSGQGEFRRGASGVMCGMPVVTARACSRRGGVGSRFEPVARHEQRPVEIQLRFVVQASTGGSV